MTEKRPIFSIKSTLRGLLPAGLRRQIRGVVHRDRLHAYWCKDSANWGDTLNPVLIGMLSGKRARFSSDPEVVKYLVIGSTLDRADAQTEVWGAGFIGPNLATRQRPKAIHAVRGGLTRDRLQELGLPAPEVYGDPALLLPLFFNPAIEPLFEIGVIPHYTDRGHPLLAHWSQEADRVKIIDVGMDIFDFVRAVKSCRMILSSSLHGLICADAYGIPNSWCRLGGEIIGGNFKYHDYFSGVGRELIEPTVVTRERDWDLAVSRCWNHGIQFDPKHLLNACPFRSAQSPATGAGEVHGSRVTE